MYRKEMRLVALLVNLIFTIVTAVVVGVWLDWYFKTIPVWTLVLTLLAIAYMFITLYVIYRKYHH